MRRNGLAWAACAAILVPCALARAEQDAAEQAERGPERATGPVHQVQVREAAVREEPSFLAPVIGRLGYEAPVRVRTQSESWAEVEAVDQDLRGWMSRRSLLRPSGRLDLFGSGRGEAPETAAQRPTRSLAGRGFDEQVEAAYRASSSELDAAYGQLDRLLARPAFNVPADEVAPFMVEGELQSEGGR